MAVPPPPPSTYVHSFPPLSSSSWTQVTAAHSAAGQEAMACAAGQEPRVAPRAAGQAARKAAASLLMADAAPGTGADAAGAEDPVLPGAHAGDPPATAAYARAVAAAVATGLSMPPPTAPLPGGAAPAGTAALSREAVNAGAQPREAAGAGGTAALLGAPFPAPPPPLSRPTSALAAALIAARATAAEGRAHVHEAALAWEHERDAADALARQIAEADQLLGLPASANVGATSSGSAGPSVSHRDHLARSGQSARGTAPLPGRGCPEHPAPGPGRP
jgi:hypothetical protein